LKSPIKLSQMLVVDRDYFDYAMIAISAHGKQMYGDLPYSYHLAMVDYYVCDFGFTEYKYRAAAWLHDTVEDTDTTIVEIADVFGQEVGMLVWACTGVGATRKERNACIYKRLKDHPDAALIKCADRYANIKYAISTKNMEKLALYILEWEGFKAAVSPLMIAVGDHRKSYFFNMLDDLMIKAAFTYEELERTTDKSSE
jgi:guanosine-3',5'-bis(diphosphate) 3'-pyrophosphohydrolase